MRKIRIILPLLIGIAVCFTMLRLAESPKWAHRRAAAKSGRLFDAPFTEIDFIKIDRGALHMRLERDGSKWHMTQPLATGADAAAVMRFLDILERAPMLDQLQQHDLRRSETSLADFGLEAPVAGVVIAGPSYRREISFGMPTPAGNGVYVKLDSSGKSIVVTYPETLAALPTTVEQWRARALFGEHDEAWVVIELRRPNAPFIKLVYDNNAWQITQPVAARASTKAVTAIVEALQSAVIEDFVGMAEGGGSSSLSEASRLAYWGLDSDNALQAQLWERGDPVGRRVRLGREVEGRPGLIYALTPGDNTLVAVTNTLAQVMPSKVAEIRSRRIFDGELATLCRCSVQFANETVTVVSKGEAEERSWRMTAPEAMEAEESDTRQFINTILSLKADAFGEAVTDVPAGEVVGGVELELVDGSTQKMSLGMSAEREGWYELRPDSGTTIFEITAANMPSILVDPGLSLTLAGRTMLKIAPQDLQRIVVKGEGRDESVERKAAVRVGLWTATDGVADSEALQAWALALARLRATAVARLGADTQTLAAFGLDEPWLEITIDVNSSSALRHILLIGRPAAKGGRYATVRGHNVVYEMSAESVALFARQLTVK